MASTCSNPNCGNRIFIGTTSIPQHSPSVKIGEDYYCIACGDAMDFARDIFEEKEMVTPPPPPEKKVPMERKYRCRQCQEEYTGKVCSNGHINPAFGFRGKKKKRDRRKK